MSTLQSSCFVPAADWSDDIMQICNKSPCPQCLNNRYLCRHFRHCLRFLFFCHFCDVFSYFPDNFHIWVWNIMSYLKSAQMGLFNFASSALMLVCHKKERNCPQIDNKVSINQFTNDNTHDWHLAHCWRRLHWRYSHCYYWPQRLTPPLPTPPPTLLTPQKSCWWLPQWHYLY